MKQSIFTILTFVLVSSLFSCDKKHDKNCNDKDHDKKECFNLLYPVSYLMPDGTTITGDEEKVLDQLIKDWYLANDGNKNKYELIYPVSIKSKKVDGIITFENEDEFADWKIENCKKKDQEDGDK